MWQRQLWEESHLPKERFQGRGNQAVGQGCTHLGLVRKENFLSRDDFFFQIAF